MFRFILGLSAIFCIYSQGAVAEMKINSGSITNNGVNKIHACTGKGGENLAPAISVSDIPNGTKYLAIVIDDSRRKTVHWNVLNIILDGNEYSVDAGKATNGMIGKSSGRTGYLGMCSKNPYRFAAFAMKQRIKVSSVGFGGKAYTIEDFEKKHKKAIIEKSVIKAKLEK